MRVGLLDTLFYFTSNLQVTPGRRDLLADCTYFFGNS